MRSHRPLIPFAVLAFACPAIAEPAKPPYDVFPAAEAPYFRVRYEAPAAPVQPGVLVYPVNYTIWVPPGVKILRGIIVHQHGCGEGSCKSGLTGAYDLHWQALARKHDCALLSPAYEQPEKENCQLWCDPRNGSDAAFQKALVDLTAKTGHPELTTIPWALWGHSGGGHWAGGMVLLHPERVAAAWLRSGVPPVKGTTEKPSTWTIPELALQVPVMCNLGTKEGVTVKEGRFAGVWNGVQTFFTEMRSRGALIGVAPDPLTSHECGNQRYLAIPWLDACLTARLPDNKNDVPGGTGLTTAAARNTNIVETNDTGAQPADGSAPAKVKTTKTTAVTAVVTIATVRPLKPMPADAAWLVPLYTGEPNIIAPVPAAKFTGARETSVWLPNEAVAWAWAQYIKDSAVLDTTPPPAPTHLQVSTLKGATTQNQLTWESAADPESGLAGFVIERDGKEIANVPNSSDPAAKKTNPFGRPVFQGLQYSDTPLQPLFEMTFTDPNPEPGKTHQYRVISVNTVGMKSL